MKIFGSRKKKSDLSESQSATSHQSQATGDDEKVASYFDSDFRPASSVNHEKQTKKKQKNAGGDVDIKTLLAMDPTTLNAKQRRLVRRHKEREQQGGEKAQPAEGHAEADLDGIVDANTSSSGTANVTKQHGSDARTSEPQQGHSEVVGEAQPSASISDDRKETNKARTGLDQGVTTVDESKDMEDTTDLVAKLEGLNSKERRKLLRKLRREDPRKSATESDIVTVTTESKAAGGNTLLAAAEEEARRIAERNRVQEKEQQQQQKEERKRKREDAECNEKSSGNDRKECAAAPSDKDPCDAEKDAPKKKNKKAPKDLSHLPPEERERRERQRQMQKEAAERRAAGLVDPNRHPLNSERRRANRRKPGRAGILAMARKERKAHQAEWNKGGFHMRRARKHEATVSNNGE